MIAEGFQVHYNLVKPHIALEGRIVSRFVTAYRTQPPSPDLGPNPPLRTLIPSEVISSEEGALGERYAHSLFVDGAPPSVGVDGLIRSPCRGATQQ